MSATADVAINNSGSAITACNLQYPNWGYTYPQTIYYPTAVTPSYDFQVRSVENGFILTKDFKEYAFSTVESLTKFIASIYKKEK